MRRTALALAGLLVLLAAPVAGQAQVEYDLAIAPQLLRDDADDLQPGLRMGYVIKRTAHRAETSFSRSFFFESTGRAHLVRHPGQIPGSHEARVAFGAEVSLRQLRELDLLADPDADDGGAFVFDYGVLGIDLAGGYEASADLDEQAVRAGVEVRYTAPETAGWLPSALAAVQALRPVHSEARDALGEDRALFWRLDAGLYWWLPLGPFALALEGAGFRALGLDATLERAGFDEGLFGSAALLYRPFDTAGRFSLDEVFVRWTEGQRPTAPADRRAWALGLSIGVH